ncbi:MAG: sodium-dependent transporter [Bacteroidales bacterium]|nr:sodium-dependent transporter [Bacteroidales bacterium]MBR6876037.1 sodium-dependent transporter [Bacteroidales bacterium]
MKGKREKFGGRLAVILAMAGSAIGLGNIWRFPYMVGEHGGAAFVFVYILATILISLPVFLAEVMIGRRSHTNARDAFARLSRHHPFWRAAGYLTILIPTLIASYYSVIGGWSVEYFVQSCGLTFVKTAPERVSGLFAPFVSSTWTPVLMHLVFLTACVGVVAGGVKSGIEKFSKVSLPVLFVLIIFILGYSVALPGAGAGVRYLLHPDWSELTPRTFAYAMGQSFFSLSLGMGAIITYGSYVSKRENILVTSSGTAVSDLLFAILAGFAIMPAVFAAGIEPGAGPGLIFQTIPYVFSKMGADLPVLSAAVSILFFLAIIVAAMTSLISLVEVGVSFLMERKGLSRGRACLVVFAICGSLGTLCSLSFGPLADATVAGMSIFDLLDWVCSNILLLTMALLSVLFVGWILPRRVVRDEFTNGGTVNGRVFPVLYFLIKWVAPIAVVIIFCTNFIL